MVDSTKLGEREQMREVVQKVIEAEGAAKEILAQARTEAERLLADAQRQARENADKVTGETRREAQQEIDAAVQKAEAEKQAQLTHADAELDQQVRLDEALKQRLVAAAVACVCGLGQETRCRAS